MGKIYAPDFLWDGMTETIEKERAFLVEENTITFVGTLEECLKKDPKAETERGRFLIVPGFVDAHDHGRGISPIGFSVPDMCLEMWLQNLYKIPAISHRLLAYYDGLRLASAGVTTVLHSHNPNRFEGMREEIIDAAKGYSDAGIRSILCPLYLDQNKGIYAEREKFICSLPKDVSEYFRSGIQDKKMTIDEYLELIDSLREDLREEIASGMVEIQLHPNGGHWCSDEALLRMKRYAIDNHMKIHMHLLETRYQKEYAFKSWGCSFISHYEAIGMLGPWLTCAHMVHLEDEDIDLLAQHRVMCINNPSSNIRLRSGMFRLTDLVDADVPVGLGLDGCAYDDDQDYLREIRTAFYNMSGTGVDGCISPYTTLKMATSKGSMIADGRLSEGVIREGAKADFVMISLEQLTRPYADESVDMADLLIHRGCRACVEKVFVGGTMIINRQEYQKKLAIAEAELVEAISESRKINQPVDLEWKKTITQKIHDFYKEWE